MVKQKKFYYTCELKRFGKRHCVLTYQQFSTIYRAKKLVFYGYFLGSLKYK